MKRLTTLAVAIAMLTVAPFGSAYASMTAVRVKGGEFFFKLSTTSITRPGTVTFTFKNVGHVVHDFKIDAFRRDSDTTSCGGGVPPPPGWPLR